MNTILIPLLLESPANVKLAIWNTAGAQLAVLKNEFMEPGQYELQVSAAEAGLAPRAYIYHLEVQTEAGIFSRYRFFSVRSGKKPGKKPGKSGS